MAGKNFSGRGHKNPRVVKTCPEGHKLRKPEPGKAAVGCPVCERREAKKAGGRR